MRNKSLTIFFCIYFTSLVHSQAYFGFEWTFTNNEIVQSNIHKPPTMLGGLPALPHQMGFPLQSSSLSAITNSPINQAVERWVQIIKRDCPDCIIEGRKITLPSGFWFQITTDFWAVEVKTKPISLEEFRALKEPLQHLVWDAANQAGVKPHERLGGGHIHLDIEKFFGGDRLAFRNFIVDLVNRPELFMGAFGLNYFNAPPLSLYGRGIIDEFTQIIRNFDQNPGLKIQDLTREINNFYSTIAHPVIDGTSEKLQAVNLTHFDLGLLGTIELRGLCPQISALHTKLIMEIFTKRINKLKELTTPITINIPDYSNKFSAEKTTNGRVYKNSISSKQILTSLENYLKDAGVQPERYHEFITEELKESLKRESEVFTSLSCSSFL